MESEGREADVSSGFTHGDIGEDDVHLHEVVLLYAESPNLACHHTGTSMCNMATFALSFYMVVTIFLPYIISWRLLKVGSP